MHIEGGGYKMKKSVVFLDIDGVLFHSRCDYDMTPGLTTRRYILDKACVEQLNRITKVMGADIVISSSWRKCKDFKALVDYLYSQGIEAKIIGRTGSVSSGDRGEEILDWLGATGREIVNGNYLVIDDDSFDIKNYIQKDKFFHVSGGWVRGGMTKKMVDRFFKLHGIEG